MRMRKFGSMLLWTVVLVLLPMAAFAEDGSGGGIFSVDTITVTSSLTSRWPWNGRLDRVTRRTVYLSTAAGPANGRTSMPCRRSASTSGS